MDDQRDYEEEQWALAEYRRECQEEYEYERLEKLGLIPEEHLHGSTYLSTRRFVCADCHDDEECEQIDCIFCP